VKANADEDERSLIEAAQADPARFVDLYERHFHRVYAYVSRRASSRDDAEDVTSEVFEHALTNLRKLVARCSVSRLVAPDCRECADRSLAACIAGLVRAAA